MGLTKEAKLLRKVRNKADKEWSREVRARDGCCVVCGAVQKLNAHHILPREIIKTRHNLDNGITLCPKHHRFSKQEISAHQNPFAFFVWLRHNRFDTWMKIKIIWEEIQKEMSS
jgi:hypothetical protein